MSLADGLTFFHKFDSLTPDYPTSGLTTGNPGSTSDPSVSGGVATFGTGAGGKAKYWQLDSGVFFTDGTADFTLAFRGKTTTSHANANTMISAGPSGGGRNATLGQASDVSNRWHLEQTTTGAECTTGADDWANNTTVTLVARRSSSACTLWIAGVNETSGDSYAGANLDTGTIIRVTIGALQDGTEQLDGEIEFVAVWNRALYDAEIATVTEAQIASDLGGGGVSIPVVMHHRRMMNQ